MIWIGTSGWQYDSWIGKFYPKGAPKSEWLAHYSKRFSTVEVNNSFYRLPAREAFERWARTVPRDFVVTVKASRFITHVKRLKDPVDPLALFWERASGLGGKLGPVLFQLPPRFNADLERLRTFVEALPKHHRAAFEFRDPSWETPEVDAILDAAGAATVIPDRPGLRARHVVTGGWSYIRFHQGRPLAPDYPRAKLRTWAGRVMALPARDVFVYFNNDPTGAAIRDAIAFAGMLEERGATLAPVEALRAS